MQVQSSYNSHLFYPFAFQFIIFITSYQQHPKQKLNKSQQYHPNKVIYAPTNFNSNQTTNNPVVTEKTLREPSIQTQIKHT